MPSFYEQPSIFGNAVVEDVNRFNQLPFYLVNNQVKVNARWNVFDQLYGKIDWETNQGNVMRGVTPQRSPVGRSFFFPNAVTTVANKDIYQVTESKEEASVKVHKYESFQFNFMPSFTAFWERYLQFANTDIVEQIARSNNQFIETNMWFNSSYVYLAGTGLISGVPTLMGNAAGTAASSKTAAWLSATVAGNGNNGVTQNLRLRDMYNATMNLQEDLAAPPFEGVSNMPKDNDGVKGKYVFVIANEDWLNFTWDPDVQTLKPLNSDLLFNDFHGSLFGTATVKINRYPIRFNTVDIKDGAGTTLWAAGTPIDPEIFDVTDNKWKPNPYYTSLLSAPYTINWILGDSFCKTIKVGPPPKEFAQTNMSAQKFYSMKWNGEVRLTDQVLITNPDGTQELNVYGENLKLISKLTHGYLVGERRNAFPMISRRISSCQVVLVNHNNIQNTNMKLFNTLAKVCTAAAFFAAFSVQATTVSFSLAAAGVTNIPPGIGGPLMISQIILSSGASDSASVKIYDSPTVAQIYTNKAYIGVTSYATNYINTWTNYYGVVNNATNITLVDVTNTVAASTNSYPIRLNISSPTNMSAKFDNVNYSFMQSAWVTNTGVGTATLSITFVQ